MTQVFILNFNIAVLDVYIRPANLPLYCVQIPQHASLESYYSISGVPSRLSRLQAGNECLVDTLKTKALT
jgi:hypothetical protein